MHFGRNHKSQDLEYIYCYSKIYILYFALIIKCELLLHICKVLGTWMLKEEAWFGWIWKRAQVQKKNPSTWTEEDQTDEVSEQSGQQKWPLAWHFVQAMDGTFDPPPPTDWYKSSPRLKPNGPPLSIPVPLHFEHAIILRLPHLLHIPKVLNIWR